MKIEYFGQLVKERDQAGRLRRVSEYEIPVKVEDGGQALIAEFYAGEDDEPGMWVKVISWDETLDHALMNQFMHKRVKVTVEVLD